MRKALMILPMLAMMAACASPEQDEAPMIMLRLQHPNTETDAQWESTFRIISENPGCCDEVWFSTGLGIRTCEWHKDKAERMARAINQLGGIGLKGSIQIQMTIGHGDSFGEGQEECFSEKKWTGWTGSTGVEDRFCNCPSQPEFIEHITEVARIYASARPYSMWIDDDLRFENHYPASRDSRIGCWCDTCIAHFNALHGSRWTRESLDKAMATDSVLEASWRQFSTSTLTKVAASIAEAVHEVSPETKLGLQHTYNARVKDYIKQVVETLNRVSGMPVSYRPGAGDYYDWDGALGQIRKSMWAADFRKVMGNPSCIDVWVPEVESWPRTYGGRTAQGVLVEGFTAAAYGMNGVSYFTMTGGMEADSVYSYYMLRPLSLGMPVIREYIKANIGTEGVGYETDRNLWTETARYAVPVLIGEGKSLGSIGKIGLNPCSDNTDAFLKMRESYPAPAVCCSPYFGLLVPRITPEGKLRTVGLLNTRIDSQWRIRLRLEDLPEGIRKVTWREMKKDPVELALEEENGKTYVTIPEIDAWNGGFIDIR